MLKILPKIVSMLGLLALISCAAYHKSPIHNNTFELTFGASGGFTNMNPLYVINSERVAIKLNAPGKDTLWVKKVTKCNLHKLKYRIGKVMGQTCTFDQKNLNQNITVTTNGKHVVDCSWDSGEELTPEMKKLYKTITSIIED